MYTLKELSSKTYTNNPIVLRNELRNNIIDQFVDAEIEVAIIAKQMPLNANQWITQQWMAIFKIAVAKARSLKDWAIEEGIVLPINPLVPLAIADFV